MKNINIVTFFFCIILSTFTAFGQSKKFDSNLSKLIDSLKNEDQRPMTSKDSAAILYQKVIRSNFLIIKSIAHKYGFPGYDLVGEESSNNYWMLVQHSDFDVPFQKRMLKLMKVEVDKKMLQGNIMPI